MFSDYRTVLDCNILLSCCSFVIWEISLDKTVSHRSGLTDLESAEAGARFQVWGSRWTLSETDVLSVARSKQGVRRGRPSGTGWEPPLVSLSGGQTAGEASL